MTTLEILDIRGFDLWSSVVVTAKTIGSVGKSGKEVSSLNPVISGLLLLSVGKLKRRKLREKRPILQLNNLLLF